MTRQEYIKQIANSAIRAVKGTKFFPSVIIAQACLESGNGNSSLSKTPYNNHFGIKASSSWKGKKASFPTREVINGVSVMVNAYFRVYDSITDSLKDRNSLLLNNSRYKKVLIAKTAEQQCKELQAAGYATDPNYSKVLIQIIEKEGLKKYDSLAKINKIVPLIGILFLGAGATVLYENYKN